MSHISIKLLLVDFQTVKTTQYMSDMYIHEICSDIREKYNYGEGGLDHGLLFTERGLWLSGKKMLGNYDLKFGDTIEFRKKHRVLKVKTLDSSIKAILVDESQPVNVLVEIICQRIGLANADEYSFQRDESAASVHDKKKPKNSGNADGEDWLNPDKTFREQGMTETDIVVLKKKFFYSDQNVDRSDPVQLVIMYTQAHEMILSGKHPTSADEAAQFGAIQLQIEYGNHDNKKHKPGFVKVKLFVPPEYVKSKDVEKKMYSEYSKLHGTTDLNAKFRYIQLIRSMKTYGVSFFLVKEPPSENNKKAQMVLLGITKESILRMDQNTKETLTEWKLTQLRRWAATQKGFTLDFGDYNTKYYNVETMEGEQISRLIAGYIDIIIKRRNKIDLTVEPKLEEQSVVEDFVKPGTANSVSVVNSAVLPKKAQQVFATTSKNTGLIPGSIAKGEITLRNDNLQGGIAADLGILESQNATRQNMKNALATMQLCSRELFTAMHLPPLGLDPISRKWRKETAQISAEAAASHICSELVTTCSLLSSLKDKSSFDIANYAAIDAAVAAIISALSQATQAIKMLCGLTPNEEESAELLQVGKGLVDTTSNLIQSLDAQASSGNLNLNELHDLSRLIGVAGVAVLEAIDWLDVSQENRKELIKVAHDVSYCTKELVDVCKQIALQMKVPDVTNSFLKDVATVTANGSMLLTVASNLVSVISIPYCRDLLIDSAVSVRNIISAVSSRDVSNINSSLDSRLHESINAVEEALSYFVEKARNIEDDIDLEIESHFEQVLDAVDDLVENSSNPKEMIQFATELTINSTRMAEILQTKSSLIEDGNEKSYLDQNATELSALVAVMVAAAQAAAVDIANGEKPLLEKVAEVKELTTFISEPYIKGNVAIKLAQSLKGAIVATNQLIGSGKNAALSNRDQKAQMALNRNSKKVMDLFPPLIDIARDAKKSPRDFVTRYKLLQGCRFYRDPVAALISSAKTASSTCSDNHAQIQLARSTHRLMEEQEELVRLCDLLEEAMNDNFEGAIDSIRTIQTDVILQSENLDQFKGVALGDSEAIIFADAKKLLVSVQGMESCVFAGVNELIQAGIVEIVISYQNLSKPIPLVASLELSSDLLLEAAVELGDALMRVIDATKYTLEGHQEGNEELQNEIMIVGQVVAQLLRALPSSLEVSRLQSKIQTISKAFPVHIEGFVENTIENPQKHLWGAAAELTNATQSLINSTERGDAADINQTAIILEAEFAKLIGGLDAMLALPQHQGTRANYDEIVYQLATECTNFFDFMKSSSVDPDNNDSKQGLLDAARAVQESVDQILGKLAIAIPGQVFYAETAELLKTVNFDQVYQPPAAEMVPATFAETLSEVTAATSVVTTMVNELKKLNDDSDLNGIGRAVLKLAGAINDVALSGIHSAQFIAASDIIQPTESIIAMKKTFEVLIEKIPLEMNSVVERGNTQEDIMNAASLIAIMSSEFSEMLKSMSVDDSFDAAAKTQIRKFTQDASRNVNHYAETLKVHAESGEGQIGCVEGGKALEQTMQDVMVFLDVQQKGTISLEAVALQKPVIDNSKRIIDQCAIVSIAAKSFAVNSTSETLRTQFISEVEKLEDMNQGMVKTVEHTVPAQKECDEAMVEMEEVTMKSIERAIQEIPTIGIIGIPLESSAVKKEFIIDQLKNLNNLADMTMSSTRGDVNQLIFAVQELPVQFSQVTMAAMGMRSLGGEADSHVDLLSAMKDLGSTLKSFTKAIKMDSADPNEFSKIQMENEQVLIKDAILNITKMLQDQNDTHGLLFGQAADRIQSGFVNIRDRMKTAKPNMGSLFLMERDGKHLLRQLTMYLMGENQLINGEIAIETADLYDQLLVHSLSSLSYIQGDTLQSQIVEQLRDLGGTVLKALAFMREKALDQKPAFPTATKKSIHDCLNDLTHKFISIDKAFGNHSESLRMIDRARDEIEVVVAELDTSLIFAESKLLDSVGTRQEFSLIKQDILSSCRVLTEQNKTLVNVNVTDSKLIVEISETMLKAVSQLAASLIAGASGLPSSENALQIKLLACAKLTAESTQNLLSAFTGALINEVNESKFTDAASDQLAVIKELVILVQPIGKEKVHTQDIAFALALKCALECFDKAIEALKGSDPALGTALPFEVSTIARQMAGFAAMMISTNSKDSPAQILKRIGICVGDLSRAGKAAVSEAPPNLRKLMIDACIQLASATRQFLALDVSQIGQTAAEKKKVQNASVKSVSLAVVEVIKASDELPKDGYVDQNDPDVIAERDLLKAAISIEEASQKFLVKSALVPRKEEEAGVLPPIEEQILDFFQRIVKSSSVFIRSTASIHREIMSQDKNGMNLVKSVSITGSQTLTDTSKNEGLVPAALSVIVASHDLCAVAQEFVDNTDRNFERILILAKTLGSTSLKLMFAGTSKGDILSDSYFDFQTAGKSITESSSLLVAALDSMYRTREEVPIVQKARKESAVVAKVMEMDAKINVIRMEKELERARMGLIGSRKTKFDGVQEVEHVVLRATPKKVVTETSKGLSELEQARERLRKTRTNNVSEKHTLSGSSGNSSFVASSATTAASILISSSPNIAVIAQRKFVRGNIVASIPVSAGTTSTVQSPLQDTKRIDSVISTPRSISMATASPILPLARKIPIPPPRIMQTSLPGSKVAKDM